LLNSWQLLEVVFTDSQVNHLFEAIVRRQLAGTTDGLAFAVELIRVRRRKCLEEGHFVKQWRFERYKNESCIYLHWKRTTDGWVDIKRLGKLKFKKYENYQFLFSFSMLSAFLYFLFFSKIMHWMCLKNRNRRNKSRGEENLEIKLDERNINIYFDAI